MYARITEVYEHRAAHPRVRDLRRPSRPQPPENWDAPSMRSMSDCHMTWQLTDDIAAFDEATGAFLAVEPTRNTLLLSIPSVLRTRGPLAFSDQPPRYGWFEDAAGTVRAALLQTPPYPVVLSDLPDGAAASLVQELLVADLQISGVNASTSTAEAVAAAWCAATAATAAVRMTTRLHILGDLLGPTPAPPGASRIATAADLDLLTTWYADFSAEVGDQVLNVQRVVGDRIENGTMVLWEVDGLPVSMAGISLLLEGDGIRIGPVYTPKELRGRAYAAAVTTAACRLAYERGAREVSLFTDLANPTSNALYQRLGFRPIEDRSVIDFERGAD